MSFGFSIGDCFAVIKLANDVRRDFLGAPRQFDDVLAEVRSLSIVLQDVELVLSAEELTDRQATDLAEVIHGCHQVLHDLQRILDKYSGVASKNDGRRKKFARAWKRLQWEPEDVRELRSRMTSKIMLLNSYLQRQTTVGVASIVQSQVDQKNRTICEWLSPIDFGTQQNDYLRRRQPGTGQWLLYSNQYTNWVNEKATVLFCPGIPGAGKTILASIVIEDLNQRFLDDSTVKVCFIYCNFRQKQQTFEDLLFALLRQLAHGRHPLPDILEKMYRRHLPKRTRPGIDEAMEAVVELTVACSRLYIIVDALDECQTVDGTRDRLLQELFQLQARTESNLLVTSRHIPDITEQFQSHPKIEVRASAHDVRRYLEGHIHQLPRFVARSPALQDTIITSITDAIDGMFLLAQLHFDSLIGKRSPKAMYNALTKLATGSDAYDSAYTDAMERIRGQIKDQEELAMQVLLWITCANRPLIISELQHALAVEPEAPEFDQDNIPDAEDMVSACAGLVTIDEESGIIRLVHYTTQEFFERTQSQWFSDAHFIITTICTSYLSFENFASGRCKTAEEYRKRIMQYPFYLYASLHWGHHARRLQNYTDIEFLNTGPQVEGSSQALFTASGWRYYSQETPQNVSGLHLAAYFGLKDWILSNLVELDINTEDSRGQTALSYAAEYGRADVVSLLVENGADIDTPDESGNSPLLIAVERGHDNIVRVLLDKGADVESRNSDGWSAMLVAARYGRESVARLLIERGANITEHRDNYFKQTAIGWAVSSGQDAVVRLLLETGVVDIESRGADGSPTLLGMAAEYGYRDMVQTLLDNGANVAAATEEFGWTALVFAASKGHADIIGLLLDKGADIETRCRAGKTPLIRASEQGHVTAVEVLLNRGAEIEAKDGNGQTAFTLALERADETIVQLLLARGADFKAKDVFGNSALVRAAELGYDKLFHHILDDKDADVEAEDAWYGRTPLIWAAMNGKEAMVQRLLDAGANINAKDNGNWTALSYAAHKRHGSLARLLLKRGADSRPLTDNAVNKHMRVASR